MCDIIFVLTTISKSP